MEKNYQKKKGQCTIYTNPVIDAGHVFENKTNTVLSLLEVTFYWKRNKKQLNIYKILK